MAILHILKWTSFCLSAPVRLREVDTLSSTDSSGSGPSFSNVYCLWTCLAGERSELCFNEGINDIRPGLVLPDYICDVTECLRSTETCPTKVTTFPFQCMLRRWQPVVHRSDAQNAKLSVCNVPVKQMKSCVFSPPSGNSEDFSHANTVTFEIRLRGSTPVRWKAKKCVCYNGQWIESRALSSNRRVKKSRIFCHIQSSKHWVYLRVKRVYEPVLSKSQKRAFFYSLFVEGHAIRLRGSFVPQDLGRLISMITL